VETAAPRRQQYQRLEAIRRSLLSWTNLSSRPGARRMALLAAPSHVCGRLRRWQRTLARDDLRATEIPLQLGFSKRAREDSNL
jgi:hypothetical protein